MNKQQRKKEKEDSIIPNPKHKVQRILQLVLTRTGPKKRNHAFTYT